MTTTGDNIDTIVSYEYSIFNNINLGDEKGSIQCLEEDHSLLNATEDVYGLTVLHLACQRRMVSLVKSIIDIAFGGNKSNQSSSGKKTSAFVFDIDRLDLNGNTALHYSCSSSIFEIVKNINNSSNSSNINIKQDSNQNQNLKESDQKQYEIVELLLENGSNAKLSNKLNYLPIHLACKGGSKKVVELLIEKGGSDVTQIHERVLDINQFSLQLQSLLPLTKYEEKRKEEKKQNIIENKLDRNQAVKNGPSCLHYALSNLNRFILEIKQQHHQQQKEQQKEQDKKNNYINWLQLIQLLLEKGCDPNIIDHVTGKSPFNQFLSLWPTDKEHFEKLLEINNNNNSKIIETTSIILQQLIQLLCQYGFDLTMCDKKSIDDNQDGETSLIYTCQNECLKLIFDELIHYITTQEDIKSILDARNNNGQTALFVSSQLGNIHTMQTLLTIGADVDALDCFGNSALHESIIFGHSEIATRLILCGSNVMLPTSIYPQSTPLHLAAQNNDLDIIDVLLKNGALLDALDGEKRTALQVATSQDIIQYLECHVQVTLVNKIQLVLPKFDFTQHLGDKIKQIYRVNNHQKLYDSTLMDLNQLSIENTVSSNNTDMVTIQMDKLPRGATIVANSNTIIRVKIRRKGDQYFKYITLNQLSYQYLLSIIKYRFVQDLSSQSGYIETNQLNSMVKSIVSLPNVLITCDDDVQHLRDEDELEIEFHE